MDLLSPDFEVIARGVYPRAIGHGAKGKGKHSDRSHQVFMESIIRGFGASARCKGLFPVGVEFVDDDLHRIKLLPCFAQLTGGR